MNRADTGFVMYFFVPYNLNVLSLTPKRRKWALKVCFCTWKRWNCTDYGLFWYDFVPDNKTG